jgi:hypothetical protein
LVSVLFGLNGFHTLRGELKTALELSSQLVAIGQTHQDVPVLLNAHFVLGVVLYQMGDFLAAQTHFERVSSLYHPDLHPAAMVYAGQDPAVYALCYQCFALWMLGFPDRSANRLQAALHLGREISHPHSLALALVLGPGGDALRGEGELAVALAEEGYRLATQQGFQGLQAAVLLHLGHGLVVQGKTEEGIRQIRAGRQ